MPFRRRRPLLRAAAVGGGAYLAGKKVQEGRDEENAAMDEPQSGGGGHNFGFAVRKNSPNLARPNGLIYVFSAGLLAGRKLSAWSHVLAV